MVDQFLETLRADWRVAPTDLGAIYIRHSIHRRSAMRRRRASIAGAILFTGLFFLFGWMALSERDTLLGIAALAFLAGSVVSVTSAILASHEDNIGYDETPAGHLRELHHQMEVERRFLWGARWVARILVFSVVLAIGITAFGYGSKGNIVILALAWGLTAAAVWQWQSWRSSRLLREMEQVAALLVDMERTDEAA